MLRFCQFLIHTVFFSCVLFFCFYYTVGEASAAYGARFKLLGAVNFSKPILENSIITADESVSAYGGGLSFEFNLSRVVGVELGAYYLTRKTQFSLFRVSYSMIQIPLLLKLNFLKFFYLGGGGYYSMGMGEVVQEDLFTSAVSTISFSNFGIKPSEFGAMASLGADIPVHRIIGIILEIRISIGLSNVSETPNVSYVNNENQGFFGIRIGRGTGTRR